MSFSVRSCLFALSLMSSVAFAQTGTTTTATPDRKADTAVSQTPTTSNEANALRLTLDDAITAAAKNNLGVDLQRYDFRMAGYSALSAYGPFDWNAFANLQTSSTQQPQTVSVFSSKTEQTVFDMGVRQHIPTGGDYSVGFNNTRQKNNSPFATVNPAYSSGLVFDFTQPLLRDFGVDVNMRGVRIARNTLGINREVFRDVLTQTVLGVENAYYDLIFARENLEVKRQSRFLAQDQERITQIRIDVGASAPLDILQPRVAITTREEEVIAAEAQLRDAEDRLRQLMNLPMSEWDRPIVPATSLGYTAIQPDPAASVQRALENRPELKENNLVLANRKIQLTYAKNQVLPALDLNVNYGLSGLGGNRIVRDANGNQIAIDRGGYSDALSQIGGWDYPSWTVGLNVGVPITNIGARSERKRAELDVERTQTDQKRIEQNVTLDVRQAVRNLDTLAKEIGATRAAREAAEKNLDAERKRFENGMTTNFNILLIQQDLSDARSREIAAVVAYNKAVADYHRSTGDLLEVRNIAVQDPEQFNFPRSAYEGISWLKYDKNSK